MKIDYTKTTLKNGIRVIVAPKKETNAVSIQIFFGVGSRYEEEKIGGIAHFLEHMAFKGTKKRPTQLDISKEIDSIGGSFNAATGPETTRYWVYIPSKKFMTGIDILSDMLKNSRYSEKDIEKEKGIIQEEIKQYYDDPSSFAQLMSSYQIFGDTPLGRFITGTHKTVGVITRKKIIDFIQRFYNPDNIVITITGNVSASKARETVRKAFGSLRGTTKDMYEKNTVHQLFPQVKVYKRDIEQVQLMLGFRAFARDHKDRYAIGVLEDILGGYMSSKLFIEIREKRGLAYSIGSSADFFHDTGDFVIGSGLNNHKLQDAVKAINAMLRKAKRQGFTPEEIRMAKENAIGRMSLRLENSQAIGSFLGSQEILERDIKTPDYLERKIRKVTNSDLKRVAQKLFRPEKFNMVVVGPLDPKEYEQKLLALIKL